MLASVLKGQCGSNGDCGRWFTVGLMVMLVCGNTVIRYLMTGPINIKF